MELNEIPSPGFVMNEAGLITVFLPAFTGEPSGPFLSKKDENVLHFQRSPEGDILLTEINESVMEALSRAEKLLVVEMNMIKNIEFMEKAINSYLKSEEPDTKAAQEEMKNAVERAYEARIRF